ncbi:MAG: PD-(D/E)XK nuclease family protein [Terrimicrobiaceae bacterium]|nr:PD-(D/E)XK nuclease family protein [Terrimicrobiaceae bacterium]
MSLFREIRRLCLKDAEQHEDILTEIVAAVLQNNHHLAQLWLRTLEIEFPDDATITVETQYAMDGLADHETDSRVDLVLRISNPLGKQIVFVESKVGSTQGKNQLGRYAALLRRECEDEGAQGTLVFLTQSFEEATDPSVPGVKFVRARWFQFYKILKSGKSSDGLEKQLMLFMEERHMSVGNQFRSTDLVALENFRGAKAVIDETLAEACDEWKKVFGKRGQLNKAHSQMGKDGCYMISTRFPGFEVLLGYWFPAADSDDGVSLGLVFQSDPKASNRSLVLEAFQKWAEEKGKGWESWALDNPREWASITRWEWLRVFLTRDDHVAAVKAYFRELLEDVRAFQARFPELPWMPLEAKDDAGE